MSQSTTAVSRAGGPPLQFDEYTLGAPLGAGTSGQVFVAHDRLLGRDVAVKFLTVEGGPAREQLLFEARALARLQHPNVVTLYRVGEIEGRSYLVSELLRGRSLDAVSKPVPQREVLALGLGLARGLAAAHRAGVLHRDVKPANSFLTDDGVVKLIDFGLAHLPGTVRASSEAQVMSVAEAVAASPAVPLPALDATLDSEAAPNAPARQLIDIGKSPSPARKAGRVVGSPLYMAPEAWRGEEPTPASDVYGLGAVLYELLAGRFPRRSLTVDALAHEAQTSDLPPLAVISGDVDPRLAAIIDRCVKRNAHERFVDGEALRIALETIAQGTTVALPDGSPYRGLLAFEAEHRALFFGRDEAARTVIDRLRSDPWVVVTAESGAGKSSLCRAAVLPELERGALGRSMPGRILVPSARPLSSLAAALAPWLERSEESVRAQLAGEPLEVGRGLRRRFADGVALLVDQLEELVTLSSRDEASAFARAISALALETRAVKVIATVRGDFLSRVLAVDGFPDSLVRACFALRPLDDAALVEVVERPAAARGFRFESPDTVAQLVAAARAGDGTLPLLQFALAELWEQRDTARGVIDAGVLERLGGVEGSLTRHSDGVLASLAPGPRAAAQQVLLSLVSADGTRARRQRSQLQALGPDADVALDALIRGRLVMSSGDEAGESVYQLTQEALLSHWATLRGWLEGEAEHRRAIARIERAASEWERLGQPVELLLRGRQLLEVEELPVGLLGARERSLMVGSRRHQRLQTVRRWAIGLGSVVVLALALRPVAKARYDRGQRLAFLLTDAEASRVDAENQMAALLATHAQALQAFDRGDTERGEHAWAEMLAKLPAVDGRWQQRERTLAEASSIEPSIDRDLARAKATASRIALWRLLHPLTEPPQLTQSLVAVDHDGAARAALDEGADVPLSLPTGVSATFSRDGASAVTAERSGMVHLSRGVWQMLVAGPAASFVDLVPVLSSVAVERSVAVPSVPAQMAYVPAGEFLSGSEDDNAGRFFLRAAPLHLVHTGGYLIAKHEITLGEWVAFLDSLPPAEADLRRPDAAGLNGIALQRTSAGWQLSLTAAGTTYIGKPRGTLSFPGRQRPGFDWRLAPVAGISLADLEAFAKWQAQTGQLPHARLCSDLEWERGARGADGRRYPQGETLAPDDANFDETWGRKSDAFGPEPVGSHPSGRSPFGLDDMAGNVWEMTVDVQGNGVLHGGGWYEGKLSAISANREPLELNTRDALIGGRLCADVQ